MKKYLYRGRRFIYNLLKRSLILISFIFILFLISCTDNSGNSQVTTDTTPTTSDPILNNIYQGFKNSVFRLDIINNENLTVKQGTGFILNDEGLFITNAHVVEDAWTAVGRFDGNSSRYQIEGIYYYDDDEDLAIGKINIDDDFEIVPVQFTDEYDIGDSVYSVGYPKYATEANVTEGNILSTYYTSEIYDMVYIRSDSYIQQGNSGGVLSTADGKVIGVTSVSFSDGTFGAIRNVEYSFWETTNFTELTSLTNYFHPSFEVSLDKDNLLDYFDIRIENIVTSYDEENWSFIIDYELLADPTWFLKLTDINRPIFIGIVVKINYDYTLSSSNIINTTEETLVSIVLDNIYLTEDLEKTWTVFYDEGDTIESVNITFSISYAEGNITVYE